MTKGRRDFFSYRDLAIKDASGGQMRGQVMKAQRGMTQPTAGTTTPATASSCIC